MGGEGKKKKKKKKKRRSPESCRLVGSPLIGQPRVSKPGDGPSTFTCQLPLLTPHTYSNPHPRHEAPKGRNKANGPRERDATKPRTGVAAMTCACHGGVGLGLILASSVSAALLAAVCKKRAPHKHSLVLIAILLVHSFISWHRHVRPANGPPDLQISALFRLSLFCSDFLSSIISVVLVDTHRPHHPMTTVVIRSST